MVLCLLFAVGAVIGIGDQAQQAYRSPLSSAVNTRWATGSTMALSQAALLLLLWVLWRVTRKAALFAAFFAAERALPGQPFDRTSLRFAIGVQISLAALFAAAGTFLLITAPLPALPAPAVNLRQAEAVFLLGPLAPVAITLAALLTYDFIDYWVHRAWHRFAFLWRFHAVHHSAEQLDSLNSYSHPLDLLTGYVAYVAISLLIGFNFEPILLVLAFQTIQSRLVHSSAPVNFGPLGAVLVDNRTHFIHHTRAEARSGKNFAGTFTIWDRLFGTYERPKPGALPETGLEDNRPPATIVDFFLARLSRARDLPPTASAPT